MDRIELKVYKPKAKEERRCVQISGEADAILRRCVQISGEADAILRRLCRATGLSNGYIVSQMIIQGEKLVDIVEVTE